MLTWTKLLSKDNFSLSFLTNAVHELTFFFSCVVVEEVALVNELAELLTILPRRNFLIFAGPSFVCQVKPGIGVVWLACAGVLALSTELKCWRVVELHHFSSFLLDIAHFPSSFVIRNTIPVRYAFHLEWKLAKVVVWCCCACQSSCVRCRCGGVACWVCFCTCVCAIFCGHICACTVCYISHCDGRRCDGFICCRCAFILWFLSNGTPQEGVFMKGWISWKRGFDQIEMEDDLPITTFWTPSRYLTPLIWSQSSFSVNGFQNSTGVGDTLGPLSLKRIKGERVAIRNLGTPYGAILCCVFGLIWNISSVN